MKNPILLSIAFLLAACATDQRLTVDALYTNGVIWTGETGADDAKSFAVNDGKIVATGNVDLNAAQIIDLQGRFVMPGMRADLVILSADPRAIDPVYIPEINVIETVIGGESVYNAID